MYTYQPTANPVTCKPRPNYTGIHQNGRTRKTYTSLPHMQRRTHSLHAHSLYSSVLMYEMQCICIQCWKCVSKHDAVTVMSNYSSVTVMRSNGETNGDSRQRCVCRFWQCCLNNLRFAVSGVTSFICPSVSKCRQSYCCCASGDTAIASKLPP